MKRVSKSRKLVNVNPMTLLSKNEWFRLESPIGEPDAVWHDTAYCIERSIKSDGSIIWFGINTNWVKKSDQGWQHFVNNPTIVMPGPDGKFLPHNDKKIWVDCDEPIYETLYKQL